MQSRGPCPHRLHHTKKTARKNKTKTYFLKIEKMGTKRSRYNVDLSIENIFLLFCFYIPLEKDAYLRFILISKNTLWHVSLKLVHWFNTDNDRQRTNLD